MKMFTEIVVVNHQLQCMITEVLKIQETAELKSITLIDIEPFSDEVYSRLMLCNSRLKDVRQLLRTEGCETASESFKYRPYSNYQYSVMKNAIFMVTKNIVGTILNLRSANDKVSTRMLQEHEEQLEEMSDLISKLVM